MSHALLRGTVFQPHTDIRCWPGVWCRVWCCERRCAKLSHLHDSLWLALAVESAQVVQLQQQADTAHVRPPTRSMCAFEGPARHAPNRAAGPCMGGGCNARSACRIYPQQQHAGCSCACTSLHMV